VPHSYAAQFRAMVVEQVRSGRRVAEVAAAVEVAEATVYRWVRQDRIDRGELEGTATAENAELRAAKRRIAELEAELATVRRASELFGERRVVRPKELFGLVESLAEEGHGTKRVCRLLSVAASGFFRWRSKPPSDRAIRRAWLTDVIGQIHAASRGTYGHRRIRAELADAYGQVVNRKLIQSIMGELEISGFAHSAAEEAEPSEPGDDRRLRAPRLRPRRPEHVVDDRHHRAPHQRGQGLLLLRARRLEPQGRRLVHRPPTYRGDGQRGLGNGHRGSPPGRRSVGSFRSRDPRRIQLVVATPCEQGGVWWFVGSKLQIERGVQR
jgi:transposase-like protein